MVKTTTAGIWMVFLKDVTQNWYLQQNVRYSGPGASAEWIEEATQVNGAVDAPANFHSVGFSNLQVAEAGKWYYTSMKASSSFEIVQGGRIWAYPNGLTATQPQRFSVGYYG